MTDCLSLLHGSTTFSPPFTVYHVDSCGSSCYVVLFGLKIFLFHLFSLLKFCTFFFFFWVRGKWGRVDMVWLSDALVHGYDLALWFLGFFFSFFLMTLTVQSKLIDLWTLKSDVIYEKLLGQLHRPLSLGRGKKFVR